MRALSTPNGSATHMLVPSGDDPERLIGAWKLAYRIARRSTMKQPEMFDDVYQECMLRAWERIEQGQPRHIVNYAMKQAAMDLMTGGRPTGSKMGGGKTDAGQRTTSIFKDDDDSERLEFVIEPKDVKTLDMQATTDLRDAIRRAFLVLKPHHREILYLFFWEGLTHAEIADRMGMSHQSISAVLIRSYPKLRDSLADVRAA